MSYVDVVLVGVVQASLHAPFLRTVFIFVSVCLSVCVAPDACLITTTAKTHSSNNGSIIIELQTEGKWPPGSLVVVGLGGCSGGGSRVHHHSIVEERGAPPCVPSDTAGGGETNLLAKLCRFRCCNACT